MNNIENNKNLDNSSNNLNMTDSEMESQFIERNDNLKKSLSSIVDKIDNASSKTHDYLAQNVVDETTLSSGIAAPKSSNILEQTNTSSHFGFGTSTMDIRLMNSIRAEINAMHSIDAEQFEGVAVKMDETFGHNALI